MNLSRQTIRNMTLHYDADEKDDDEDEDEIESIEWMNIIFLPFHPVFRLIVLCAVIIKITVCPIETLYPIIYCEEVMETTVLLTIIKNTYVHLCDIIYAIDTLLHIVHRIADVAKRRQYLPKSKLHIMLDVISMIPFYRLLSSDVCPPMQFWPNVLNLVPFLIVYRIEDYFSLRTTHILWKIIIGYTLLLLTTTNFMACSFILITHQEIPKNSTVYLHDWRTNLIVQINETDSGRENYIKAVLFVSTYMLHQLFVDTKPENMTEYYIAPLLMVLSFLIYAFVVFPKAFGEALLKLRRTFEFFPRVQKIVAETQRRSSSVEAHVDVTNFYNLMWKKRCGITSIPDIITEFPRYLRLDIKQDLTWPIFYHSPTLRRVSQPFIHFLCDVTHLDFKLPKENFFASPHCLSNLFYLKSGIVQLISAEDGTTPLLSMTGGTIFGDINFFLPPPASKNVIVRCLTYCEIYFFTRADILKALHKFPEDRRKIMERIKNKIKHARTLYTCKQHIRGLDRAEDEGVAWIERRWWELNEAISNWKKTSTKAEKYCELPPEEAVYHCSKYIGQLVLCPDEQLQRQSMFANCQFPWILAPDSAFVVIWQRIVRCTVALVLILYPPNLPLSAKPKYFLYFQAWANIVYIADICLSLLTAIEDQGHLLSDFASVMFERCKSSTFILDLLATLWIEDFVVIIGKPELYTICQFNRLIKVYVVFFKNYVIKDIKSNPIIVVYQATLLKISYVYVTGYFIIAITKIEPNLTVNFFFGPLCAIDKICDPTTNFDMFNVAISWAFRNIYFDPWPSTLHELYAGMMLDYISSLIIVYCGGRLIPVIYLKNKHTADYLFFALNINHSFKAHFLHPELWIRLKKYLVCYWKYNKEIEVTDAHLLRHEPYDIYWKAHGEIAAQIIMKSKAFVGANPALIKELAHNAKFMILPKHSTVLLTGVPVKDVCWLVNGVIIKECHTEAGVVTEEICESSERLVSCSVFFGRPSLVTCTTHTECEILCISTIEFFRIISRYPLERVYIRSVADSLRVTFNDLFKVHMATRKIYHWNEIGKPSEAKRKVLIRVKEMSKSNWRHPESGFMKYWMAIRAVSIAVCIITSSLEGGSGAVHRRILMIISALCDCITISDIVIKTCTAYYDKRGLLIYSTLKCMSHYFTRGFILDIIATVPWDYMPTMSPIPVDMDTALLVNALSKYARLHLLMGYFDYLADVPVASISLLMLIKWQLFAIQLLFTTSHYLVTKCVKFEWNDRFELINASKRDACWMPTFLKFDNPPTSQQLDLLFGESFNLAQYANMGVDYGLFGISQSDLGLGVVLFTLTIVYWCIFCYAVAMLTLSRRGSTLFQHAFGSLDKFLHAERLDKELINRSLAHFSFWWRRTKGVNINDNFIHKGVSSLFRQDLYYFFYKQTFVGLDMVLKGGEQMMKHLSCVGLLYYLLPNVPIMREMDLNPWVFIVHRGEVVITQEGRTLAVLKKGSIFGQLKGTGHRPVRISAHTTQYTDVIRIPVVAFQENIDDRVRLNIHQHPDSAFDYIQLKDPPKENPYNTVKYLLRGGKSIQLPWMKQPLKTHVNAWYSCWLCFVWVIGPFTSAAIVLLLNTLPLEIIHRLLVILILLDILHFAHFVTEFYTMELVVINDQCQDRHIKLRKFKEWPTYLDILSLLLPMLTIFTNNWGYQLARLLRLRFFYDFHTCFCQDFKSQLLHVLIDFAIISLIIHAMVCGWVVVACRPSVLVNSYYIPKYVPPEYHFQKRYNEWIDPDVREEGCKTIVFASNSTTTHGNKSVLVPIRWQDDYAIALGFVISRFTRANSGTYASVTYKEVLYKCVMCFILNLISIWISSLAFRALYLKYRELLNFDYDVANLFSYLTHNGLTKSLLECVKEYTILLWQKQGGNWMPELVLEAPLCLREDLYVALYSYHLQDIPLFRTQPAYFTRQLATRLHRVVLFPGRAFIQAGDIFACMYFIHEGEVEKWYTDASGEKKMVSLLTTNGFFGVIPGLFPDSAVQFTFITRTVVDMVFLRHRDWQDLLEGYTDIKRDLYIAAKQLKKDLGKT